VVTDSTADLPVPLVEELGIGFVPLQVHFGEEHYRDIVELTPALFYEKLVNSHVHPRTSQPSPGDYAKEFQRMAAQGAKSIICLCLSSNLSGSFESAQIARDMLAELDIEVLDTRKASLGYGYAALLGARRAAAGGDKEQVLRQIWSVLERMHVYFAVDTLEYLQRNGRIGRAKALLGTLLEIKPVLTLDADGYVAEYEKVRGAKRVLPRLVDIVCEKISPGSRVRGGIAHCAALDKAERIHELLQERYQIEELIIHDLGAVISTHVGPGTTGIFLTKAD
jgi:DegV family protein with EDD domain